MVEAQGLDAEGQPGLHSFRVACLGTGLYGNSQLLPSVLSYTHTDTMLLVLIRALKV